ncbi:MAG: glycosyltransferase family 39 protein [Anaerolineae bacterium]
MTQSDNPPRPLLLVIPALLLLLSLSLFTALVVFEGIPHSQDEVVYLFQAKILRSGNLYLPSLPDGIRQFFDHEFVVNNGKWFGKYTAGASLVLATGLNFDAVAVINPILGALSLLLLYLLALRFFSWRTAVLAAFLYAVSPFSIVISATYLSHPLAQLLTVLFFFALLSGMRRLESPKTGTWAAIAGASLGAIFLTRPYNALPLLPFAGLFLGAVFRQARRSGRLPVRTFAMFAVPSMAFLAGTLAYNEALTGGWLEFPHMAYSSYDFIGFGWRGVEWGAQFGPRQALNNVAANFDSMRRWLFAWPGFLPMALVPLAFASRRWRTSLLLLALFPLQVLAYAIYFHPGTFLGPRYWFEATWVLVLLAAEGAVVLFTLLRRLIGSRVMNLLYFGGLAAVLSFSLLRDAVVLPAHKGYNRMTKMTLTDLQTPALVFVPAEERWQAYGLYFIQQSPLLDDEPVIFARHNAKHNVWPRRPGIADEQLMAYFPERNVYNLAP